jgi:hypothetical protein
VAQAANDRNHIRDLAKQVGAIAASDENARIVKRWLDVNSLCKPDRWPVWCRPVGAWEEVLPKASLKCSDSDLRAMEYRLRQILVKHEIGDDSPVEPYWPVGAVLDVDPPNVWGVDINHQPPTEAGGAWAYDPPIKTWADLEKLRLPRYTYNAAATEEALCRENDLLGDILPPRQVCNVPIGTTLCGPATDLRGMTQLMMDLIESPDEVHRMVAYLRDAALSAMDQVEGMGLFNPEPEWPMVMGQPVPSADGQVRLATSWVNGNSQEFDQVSPAMWEEFLLDYQKPLFARFGAVCYGCCENLTRKIDGVLSIPNLRTFVCSAWTDLDTVIEKVGRKHVIMWRQKASDVVFPHDTATLKRQLDAGLRKLRGHHVQIVLRELQTLAGHPDRLHVWTRLAIEAAEKYAS